MVLDFPRQREEINISASHSIGTFNFNIGILNFINLEFIFLEIACQIQNKEIQKNPKTQPKIKKSKSHSPAILNLQLHRGR